MKRKLSLLLVLILITGLFNSFATVVDDNFKVYFDDAELLDTVGYDSETCMLSESFVTEVLDGIITVNAKTNEIILEGNSNKLSLYLDSSNIKKANTELSIGFFRNPVGYYNHQLYFGLDFIVSVFDLTKTISITEEGQKLYLESLAYVKHNAKGTYDYKIVDPNKIDISNFQINDVKDNEKKLGYSRDEAEGLNSVLFYDNGNDIANKWNGKTTIQEDYTIIENLFKRTQTGFFMDTLNIDLPRMIGLDNEMYTVSYEGLITDPKNTKLVYNLKNNVFKFATISGSPAIGLKDWYSSAALRENWDGHLSRDYAELREVLRYYFNSDADFKYFWTSLAEYVYYTENPDLIIQDNIDLDYLQSLYATSRTDMVFPNGTQVHIGTNPTFNTYGVDPFCYIWFTKTE